MLNLRFFIFSFLIMASCSNNSKSTFIENGDLLFIGNTSSNLSKAINKVTQTQKLTNYSHMGIVEKKGKELWVLHAAPEVGSTKVLLNDFLKETKKDSTQVVVYRLKSAFKHSINKALDFANKNLGKPYNYSYILSDSSFYCSEFIYNSFKSDSIFEIVPMTFKNPNTDEFNLTWVEHYKELGIEIPEGKLGCNPNGMAASNKLIKVGVIE